jgi:putative phosphoribosyl transferase
MQFIDRVHAGRQLALKVAHLAGPDVVVLGLPCGGVPVAVEVASAIGAPLDVVVVRKLGVPGAPEVAMGAIGEGGVRVLNEEALRLCRIGPAQLAPVERAERERLQARVRLLRRDRQRLPIAGHTVIIVDDGMATGATARAACQVARGLGAHRVVVAVPVAAADAVAHLRHVADQVVCVHQPDQLSAISMWYADFGEVTDDEVLRTLRDADRTSRAAEHG